VILHPAANFQLLSAIALERMIYCLLAGTVLAVLLQIAVRLVPESNSRTRFVVRFALLVALLLFALVGTPVLQAGSSSFGPAGAPLLQMPAWLAEYLLLTWAAVALLGLLRIATGLWQIRRLRRDCVELNPDQLGPELQALLAGQPRSRRVSVLVSDRAHVPAAIGFLRPAVVLPVWLLEESAATELKYVLMHELAHLRRREARDAGWISAVARPTRWIRSYTLSGSLDHRSSRLPPLWQQSPRGLPVRWPCFGSLGAYHKELLV